MSKTPPAAGPALDWEVAEKVMRWRLGPIDDDWIMADGRLAGYAKGTCPSRCPVFRPSTNKSHALLAAEHVGLRGLGDKDARTICVTALWAAEQAAGSANGSQE